MPNLELGTWIVFGILAIVFIADWARQAINFEFNLKLTKVVLRKKGSTSQRLS